MTNTIELKKAMLDAGMTQRQLSDVTGIPKNTLNRKVNNYSEFTGPEISAVCSALGIVDPYRKCAIFLA